MSGEDLDADPHQPVLNRMCRNGMYTLDYCSAKYLGEKTTTESRESNFWILVDEM